MSELPQDTMRRHRVAAAATAELAAKLTAPTEPVKPERHPDLQEGEAFIQKWPKSSCRRRKSAGRHCYGRGTRGKNLTTGLWEPCRCLGKVSWKEALAFHIKVDVGGHVVEVVNKEEVVNA